MSIKINGSFFLSIVVTFVHLCLGLLPESDDIMLCLSFDWLMGKALRDLS